MRTWAGSDSCSLLLWYLHHPGAWQTKVQTPSSHLSLWHGNQVTRNFLDTKKLEEPCVAHPKEIQGHWGAISVVVSDLHLSLIKTLAEARESMWQNRKTAAQTACKLDSQVISSSMTLNQTFHLWNERVLQQTLWVFTTRKALNLWRQIAMCSLPTCVTHDEVVEELI